VLNPRAKLLHHGDRVKQWIDTGRTAPVLIEIAPTGYCNASCPWCFFKDKVSNDSIDSDNLITAIDELKTLGLKAINWTGGGEPTLHPHFEGIIAYVDDLGIKQGLFTNAYEPIPLANKFEWIRVSLTPKGFGSIKVPDVPFGICVNQIKQHTPADLLSFVKQSKSIGASYFQIRPALENNYKNQPYLDKPDFLKQQETNKFKVYLTDYKYSEAMKPKEYDECYGYHFCPSIDWKGNVLSCLYLANSPDYIFGNINTEHIMDIWKRIPEKVKVFEGCQACCKNHEINRLLYEVKHIKQVEFL
jgi:cyclic pyranopterin phosphate synthase